MNGKREREIWYVLGIFFGVFLLSNLGGIFSILGEVGRRVSPILWGLAIAFALNLPLRLLERLWRRIPFRGWQRVRRPVCLGLTVLLFFGVLFLLMFALFPLLAKTVTDFLREIPDRLSRLEEIWEWIRNRLEGFSLRLPPLELNRDRIVSFLSGIWERYGEEVLEGSWEMLLQSAEGLWRAGLALVLSLYVLARKERIGAQICGLLQATLGEGASGWILRTASLTSQVFGRFLGGQLIEALILGGLCFVGMAILQIPFALLVSVLVGAGALIPIFGALIGMGLGALLILSVDPIKSLWFLIFVILLQQVEGNFIYPRVVGKSVGLESVWVLMAVTVGSSFGVIGMLLAVPTASVLSRLLGEFIEYREKQINREGNGSVKR